MWDPLVVYRLRTFSERSDQGRFWLPWAGPVRSSSRSVIISPSESYQKCLMVERCREYFHRASITRILLEDPFYTNRSHKTYRCSVSILHMRVHSQYTAFCCFGLYIPNIYTTTVLFQITTMCIWRFWTLPMFVPPSPIPRHPWSFYCLHNGAFSNMWYYKVGILLGWYAEMVTFIFSEITWSHLGRVSVRGSRRWIVAWRHVCERS